MVQAPSLPTPALVDRLPMVSDRRQKCPNAAPPGDFQDNGGPPGWRARHAVPQPEAPRRVVNVPRRRPLSLVAMVGWFVIYPFVALVVFYGGGISLMATTGMNVWSVLVIMLAVIAYPPLNCLFSRR